MVLCCLEFYQAPYVWQTSSRQNGGMSLWKELAPSPPCPSEGQTESILTAQG